MSSALPKFSKGRVYAADGSTDPLHSACTSLSSLPPIHFFRVFLPGTAIQLLLLAQALLLPARDSGISNQQDLCDI